ncbi:serine/threonine protein kinase [Kitasatospora sp. NPDC058063]|uniref:serine/threonine protein kinase n=1 Tax=unclassified Kitasatospora TaxID=2633591 RepID=UPI0036DF5223
MALPDLIGPYRPLRLIGAGGMGTVFYCLHPGTGQPLAVKVLHADHAQDPVHRRRFAREVAVLRKVTGPYLVPLVDADPDTGQPWLATPYVPGNTLHQHAQRHGPLTGSGLTTFAAATAHALACIHWAGVAHRDLKPSNVILAADGPRVLDFGIAHHLDATSVTATRVTTGTPGWMAPEQLTRGETTTATDVFVWGMLVCFAATGRHPFGNPTGIDFRIAGGAPDLTGVPDRLAPQVLAALDRDPMNRPTAGGLAEAVAAVYGPSGTQVFPTVAFTRTVDTTAPGLPPIAALPPSGWEVPAADHDLTKVLPPPGPVPPSPPPGAPTAVPPVDPTRRPPAADAVRDPVRGAGGRSGTAVRAVGGGVLLTALTAGLVFAALDNGGTDRDGGTRVAAGPSGSPAPSSPSATPRATPTAPPVNTPSPTASSTPTPTPTATARSLFGGMGITVPADWQVTRDPRNDGPQVPANGAGVTLGRYQPAGAGFTGLLIAFDPGETADRMFPSDLRGSGILWAGQDGGTPETVTAAEAGPLVPIGGRKAQSWTVRTDVLPDYNGTRTHTHRVWWLPASHIRLTTYGDLTAAQDQQVDRMIASMTFGTADMPLDCADGVAYLDRLHAHDSAAGIAGAGCAALAFGAGTAVAQDPGTIPTGTEAACVALVQGYLEGAYGVPSDEQYAADRKGCDLPVKR